MEKEFSQSIINWYEVHKRDLPWRNIQDPYRIWLSEVILQQTRVQQGLPYYMAFIEKFPSIESLANASETDVLRTWQGLGYYSRARNLHSAAKQVVHHYNGIFPNNYLDLLKLRGVGAYTAAAVASFAFEERVAVVDGNVYRVLARVFGIFTDIASGQGTREFSELANQLLPKSESSTYNQGMMEFGALHCTPVNPHCYSCPVSNVCFAYLHNQQIQLPVKIKKLKRKYRYFHYLSIFYQDHLLFKIRADRDIWQGLYEPLLLERNQLLEIDMLLEESGLPPIQVKRQSHQYKHILTHQTIFCRFWIMEITDEIVLHHLTDKYELQLFSISQIKGLPKPVLIIKFLEQYVF